MLLASAGQAQSPALTQADAVRAAPSPSSPPVPTIAPAPVTHVGDQTRERGDFLREQVRLLLAEQAKALLRKDEEAFLRPAADGPVRDELTRRYRNLIALQVAGFDLATEPLEFDAATGQWRAKATVSFCFVVAGCRTDYVHESLAWTDTEAGPRLASIAAASDTSDSWYGQTQPWEVSDLHVAVGTRALVATTARLKGRLPELLREAEKAAVVADEFATGGSKPDIYRVYLADTNEWKTWYGGQETKWAVGYATAVGPNQSDVVLNNAKVSSSYLDDTLRHELTHVSSLHGQHHWEGNWWLIEGIAQLAENPNGLNAQDWSAATRTFVRGGWDRKFPAEGPSDSMSNSAVGSRYGVAYYAVKCLDVQFGRARLLSFFTQVVVHGAMPVVVSPTLFEKDWAAVEADCAAYTRRSA